MKTLEAVAKTAKVACLGIAALAGAAFTLDDCVIREYTCAITQMQETGFKMKKRYG